MIEQVIIRADSAPSIGYGHIMRCLGLANYLISQDIPCMLFTLHPDEFVKKSSHSIKLKIHDISKAGNSSEIIYISDVNNAKPENTIFILDGYSFDIDYFRKVRQTGYKLALIDDLADREIEADWIINHNVGAEKNFQYKINNTAIQLLGCKFAILRKEILNLKSTRESGVLITFGGADKDNIGYKAFRLLSELRPNMKVHLVHTGDNVHYDLAKQLSDSSATYSVSRRGCILAYMRSAKIALCAGGVTSLEFAHMGVPMIITIIADNQKPGANSLEKSGAAITSFNVEKSVKNLLSILDKKVKLNDMSISGNNLVDGNGVQRIYKSFMSL